MKKVLSLVLACMLVLSMSTVAFAAESSPDATVIEDVAVVTAEDSGVMPAAQTDWCEFLVGGVGYIRDCGNTPTFKFTVSGGNANTQVTILVETSGGVEYTLKPLKADGSQYIEKQYYVLNGGGAWTFTAYVSSGTNTGNIQVRVEQVY